MSSESGAFCLQQIEFCENGRSQTGQMWVGEAALEQICSWRVLMR